jgi:hypothetical protein
MPGDCEWEPKDLDAGLATHVMYSFAFLTESESAVGSGRPVVFLAATLFRRCSLRGPFLITLYPPVRCSLCY